MMNPEEKVDNMGQALAHSTWLLPNEPYYPESQTGILHLWFSVGENFQDSNETSEMRPENCAIAGIWLHGEPWNPGTHSQGSPFATRRLALWSARQLELSLEPEDWCTDRARPPGWTVHALSRTIFPRKGGALAIQLCTLFITSILSFSSPMLFYLWSTQFGLAEKNLARGLTNISFLSNLLNCLLCLFFSFLKKICIYKNPTEKHLISLDTKNHATHESLFIIPCMLCIPSVPARGVICSATSNSNTR